MKKALALFLSVGSLAAFGAAATSEVALQPLGADVFSFYSFSDQPLGRKCAIDPGPTGATIVPDCFFTNVCAKGYEAKVYVKGTGYILVTNDIPGRYLYSTRKARAPFCELKTALYQRGFDAANSTTLTMSGRAKELAQLEEHTLEFFFKAKTYHQGFGYYELDPEANGGKRIGFAFAYPVASPNLARAGTSVATVSDRTTLIDGRWHHFAVVYSKTWGGYRCYCDYLYVGDIVALEPNASGLGGNLEMRLGSLGSAAEAFSSALRITKKALAPEDFMHVSNEPDGFVAYDTAYQPAFLAKFDEVPAGSVMKDDSHPTSGTQKTFPEGPKFRGQTTSYNLAVWIKGEGSLTVSDDVPGAYVYDSLFATTPFISGHKSWQCNTGTTPKDSDYGFISCGGGGRQLPNLKRWTLEFFVKLRAKNEVTSHLVYYYMVAGAQTLLRHDATGKSVYLSCGSDTSTVTLDQPLWDGRWHHVAIVHDEDLPGGGEKGGSYFYFDGVKSTGLVPCGEKAENSNELRVGSSIDRYSFSVIRLTPEVLPSERFMVASDCPNGPLAGTSLRWKLDGDAANDIANANCSNVVTFAADGVASGSAAAVGTVTYTDDRPRGKRKTGETLDGSNRQAAALAADSSVAADGFAAVTSAGNTFTVQAFVKATSAPSELANVVGVGDGADGYAWTLALDADRQVVLKAKLAADDGTTSDFVRETGISVADGEWHQLALSADTLAREFKVYHNATLVATYGEWGDPLLHNTAGGLVAGGGLGLGSVPGSVDEVQFSRDLLTADELTTMLEQGLLLLLR